MINIFNPIINSAKKTWKGEEKFWKVFWLWGVLLYLVGFVFFVMSSSQFMNYIVLAISIYNFFLISPIFIASIIKRNIKNIKINNKFLRIVMLILILTIPFMLFVHVGAGWILTSFGFGKIISFDWVFLPAALSVIFLNILFYKNLNHQLKLIKPCHN